MSSHTHLLFKDEARAKLLKGAEKLADALRPTLGPESRSVLIEKKFGQPTVCDDGVTIAKQVRLEDQDENLGAQMLKAAAIHTGDELGDGTTTVHAACLRALPRGNAECHCWHLTHQAEGRTGARIFGGGRRTGDPQQAHQGY